MVVTLDPESAKKRKKGDWAHDSRDGCDVACTTEISPRKSPKLVHPPEDEPSLGQSSNSESDDSQERDSSLESSVSIGESPRKKSLQLQQERDAISKGKEALNILNLDLKNVFTRLLLVFSHENPPGKLAYGDEYFNLTAAYDEFWETFYTSPYYSVGHGIKIPRVKRLIDLELKSLLKILKRGWEDERYWPNKLARPFLETCLFGEPNANAITPDTFLDFIEPSDKELIKNKNNVGQDELNIFKKYCSETIVSIGDDITDSCVKAVHDIMITNMTPVIDIWGKELNGLMPQTTFEFIMGPQFVSSKTNGEPTEVDVEPEKAPHKLWKTFFLGWPAEKVDFYFKLLANTTFSPECIYCESTTPGWNAKHFLTQCDVMRQCETLMTDRHDAVLNKIVDQMTLAIERKSAYFSKGDWQVLVSYRNKSHDWPEEMSILKSLQGQLYPHIIVYSMSPEKRVLIIEYSISWEFWLDLGKREKNRKYWPVKEKLEEAGFVVEYRMFTLGCRGVVRPDIYDIFEQIFGMKHPEISKVLEEISQEIIDSPYQSKYYKELMEAAKKMESLPN